jgi:hypothetical protein
MSKRADPRVKNQAGLIPADLACNEPSADQSVKKEVLSLLKRGKGSKGVKS